MTRYVCNSCGGEYSDVGPDKLAYFHACPEEKITRHAAHDVLGNVIVPETRGPFPNRRDEAPIADPDGKTSHPRAVGAGVTQK